MQDSLKQLILILQQVDDDPQKSLQFCTQLIPEAQRYQYLDFETKRINPQAIYLLLSSALHNISHNQANTPDCAQAQCQQKTDLMIKTINHIYQKRQDLCWRSHDYHFHTNFVEYVRCPVTCLYEVIEFLTKIQKMSQA